MVATIVDVEHVHCHEQVELVAFEERVVRLLARLSQLAFPRALRAQRAQLWVHPNLTWRRSGMEELRTPRRQRARDAASLITYHVPVEPR